MNRAGVVNKSQSHKNTNKINFEVCNMCKNYI